MTRQTFYEVQAHNRLMTGLLIVAFLLLFALAGLGLDYYLFGTNPLDFAGGEAPVPVATLFALGAAGLMSLNSYYAGARQVLGATRARPASPQAPAEKQFLNVVEEMSIAAGINPPPPAYVVPDPDPNAFAVGRDPRHASIAVTRGLLEKLSREELQGVVAHELSHVRNLDIRTMTLVAALYGGLVLLSDFASRAMRYGRGARPRGRGGRSGGGGGAILLLLWLALVVLAPLLGRLMALAVSRAREYDADATGVELTRNPLGLASALRRIEAESEPTRSIGRGAAHLCIADPMGRAVNRSESSWAGLWGTHPPIARRIAILETMAGVVGTPLGSGPGPGETRIGTGPREPAAGGLPDSGVRIGHA